MINKEQFDYMDGLTLTKYQHEFDSAIRVFIIGLYEDGFEVEDVKEYVKERMERVFFEFRNY